MLQFIKLSSSKENLSKFNNVEISYLLLNEGKLCLILLPLFQFIVLLFLLIVPASRSEYHHIKHQLEAENIPGESPGDPPRSFHSLPPVEQARLEKKRLAGEPYY